MVERAAICCLQGSPDMRYIASRLAPSHRDTAAERVAFYPTASAAANAASGGVSPVSAEHLPPTEEPSLLQWASHYRVLLKAADDVAAATAALSRLQLPRQSG